MRSGSRSSLFGAIAHAGKALTAPAVAVMLLLLPNTARADQCDDATTSAAGACCDSKLQIPSRSSGVTGLRTLQPPRCLTGKTAPIVCVDLNLHGAVPAAGKKTDTPIGKSQKSQESGGSQCEAAANLAKNKCNGKFTLSCPLKKNLLGEYPDCAKLQPVIDELNRDGCGALSGIQQCVVGEKDAKSSSMPIGSTMDCLQIAIDKGAAGVLDPAKFGSDPGNTNFYSPPPSPPNATTPAVNLLVDFGGDPKLLNLLGPLFRLEIPGNFVRYQLSNAIYRSVLHNVQKQSLDGVTCDENTLVCQINPLHIVDLGTLVNTNNFSKYVSLSVVTTAKGYELKDFVGRVPDVVEAHWKGLVDLDAIEDIKIDLASSAWQWLPLHDPGSFNKGPNGQPYTAQVQPIQHKANYLDRAYVFLGLTGPQCQAMRDLKLDWSSGTPNFSASSGVALNNHYFTFTTPYNCVCADTVTTDRNNRNFCIADLHPRQLANTALTAVTNPPSAAAAGRFEVVCDQNDPQIVFGDPAPGPLMQTAGLSILKKLVPALGDPDIQAIKSTLLSFGCNGVNLMQQAIGAQTTTPQWAPGLSMNVGNRLTSAIGFGTGLNIPLGKYRATYTQGNIEVTITLLVTAERWLEEKVPVFGGFLSWILQLVQQILEAFLSATLTIGMAIISSLGNGFEIDMQSQPLIVEGVISHTASATGNTQISAGLKRILSSYFAPTVDTFQVDWKDPTSCSFDPAGGIKGEIENLVGCVVGELSNVAAVALMPLKDLIANGVRSMIFDYDKAIAQKLFGVYAQEATKLEQSSDIAKLIASSVQTLAFKPEYMLSDLPGLSKDLPTYLPAFISSICALAPQADVACAITKAAMAGEKFPGTIWAPPPQALAGFRVKRMGAKTHYRSLQDFGNIFNTDWNYPPVHFCVAGDAPPGSSDYTLGEPPITANTPAGLLTGLVDLKEIDLTMPGDKFIRDFRTQCAGFADVQIRGYVQVPVTPQVSFEVLTAMSLRTMLLINETFVCRDNQSCDLNTDIATVMDCAKQANCDLKSKIGKEAPIRLRATAAVCSLMGDIWQRECTGGTAACNSNNVKYDNLLHKLNTAGATVNNLLQVACPANSSCAPLQQAVSKIDGYATDCSNIMTNLGFVIPDQLAPADIPPEMFQ